MRAKKHFIGKPEQCTSEAANPQKQKKDLKTGRVKIQFAKKNAQLNTLEQRFSTVV